MNLIAINDLPTIVKKLVDANTYGGEKGIDIELFTEFESHFREYTRENNLRAVYRGPRISNNCSPWTTPSMTRRCDAETVKFYSV